MCINLYSYLYLFYNMKIYVNSAFSSSMPNGLVREYRKTYFLILSYSCERRKTEQKSSKAFCSVVHIKKCTFKCVKSK